MEYSTHSKRPGPTRWLYAAATVAGIAAATPAQAVPVVIDYALTGGTIFLEAPGGTPRVTVAGTVTDPVFGSVTPYSITRTGSASGATSWDLAGSMQLAVEENGDFTTSDTLFATRRAGTIDFTFPLIPLFSNSLNVDVTLRSNNSMLDRFEGGSGTLDSAGALTAMIYDLPEGVRLGIQVGGDLLSLPAFWGAQFAATNGGGGSTATLTSFGVSGLLGDILGDESIVTLPFGCLDSRFGVCLLDATVTYDLSDVSVSLSGLAATGTSAMPLPAAVPVQVAEPATLGLFGLGLVGLGFSARRNRRTL